MKMGCRKKNFFLEFMYVDVARDFVGVVFHVLLDGAKGSHNSGNVVVLSLHILSTSISRFYYLQGVLKVRSDCKLYFSQSI